MKNNKKLKSKKIKLNSQSVICAREKLAQDQLKRFRQKLRNNDPSKPAKKTKINVKPHDHQINLREAQNRLDNTLQLILRNKS